MPQLTTSRSIPASTLLFTSVSAILGSGWLFAAYYTAISAGPASILAWVLAGVGILIIAFIFAELSAMLPLTGSSARIPQYTHGVLVNFIFAWFVWLSYAAFVPTEVQAVMQYLSFFFPIFLYANNALTPAGYLCAGVLMLVISCINIFSLRWLLRCNNFLTILKLLIPAFVALAILFAAHPTFSKETIVPSNWHGVLASLTTGGIIFAFNGFKQACEMAGEAKKPERVLPFAIIGSVLVCLIIYLLLQTAFLAGLHPANLKHGWGALQLPHANSPFAGILDQNNLHSLIPILYTGAIISPLAAGLMYVSSAGRSLYAMSLSGHIGAIFQKTTLQGNPILAIIFNFVFGMCLFLPLPGWDRMISFLTSLLTITYAVGPICLLSLRQQLPNHNYSFKLPFVKLWSTIAFYICTLLIYWNGWNVISKLGIAIAVGFVILFLHHYRGNPQKESLYKALNLKTSIWFWFYAVGLTTISYLGNFGGGKGLLPFGWDFAIIALFCILTIYLALRWKLTPAQTQRYIQQLPEHTASKNPILSKTLHTKTVSLV